MELKKMSGKELVDKILRGERDFSKIKLEESFNLSGYEGFNKLQRYLKKQDLFREPINIEHSEFRYLRAERLYMPYTQGNCAFFGGAYLFGADFRKSHFEEANFKASNLEEAKFRKAHLYHADFRIALLRNANFEKANLDGGDFLLADLCGANFEEAKLRIANFEGANLTGANLQYANISLSILTNANFRGAKLKHIKNLFRTYNLETADFHETKVSQDEFLILERILSRKRLFRID